MSVVITGTLKRGESGASPFPITQPTDSAMTEINVADIAARDLIAEWRRLPFMKVYTIATSQTFRLGADVTIAGQVWTLDTGAGSGFQLTSEKGQVNGYASLDANGKIPVNQINQLFITDVFVPADQTARFALTTFRGDIAIQQDTGVAFLKLNDAGPPTDAADWASITTSAVSLITQGTFSEIGNVSITISKILTLAQNVTDFNAQVALAPAVTSLNSTLATHTLQITDLQNDKADKVNVLELDNLDAFVPTAPTHPTTKQYVDDAVAAGSGGGGGNTVGAIGDVQLTDGSNNHAAEGSFNYAIATNALTATGSRGAGGIGASSIVMGSTGGVATALNSKVFAQDTTVSGIGATSFARDTTINTLADDAFAIGRNNIVGDGTTAKSGISSGAFGADHIVHGTYAYGFGLGAQASGEQSFVMAINTRDVSDDATFQRNIASGFGSISMFENTAAQTATHGVLGRTSVAIGGRDHNIPADANRVVILGGDAIKAAAGVSDRVYIPSLSIENSGGGGAVTFISNATSIEVTTNALIAGITPILATHLATKGYVDAFVQGLDSKASCRAATTVALVDTYNGTGTGTLTKSTNGAFPSQDGITLLVNERILLKNENGIGADVDNGLYALTQVGDGSNPWILTRTTDADEDAEVTAGLYVFVTEGTVQQDTGWTISTNDPITINTTPIAFVQFSAAGVVTADNGLTKTVNNIQLGGTLTGATTISRATNNLDLNGLLITDALITASVSMNTIGGFVSGTLTAGNSSGWIFRNEVSSGTNPTLIPNRSVNNNTGIGGSGADIDLITASLSRLNIANTLITSTVDLEMSGNDIDMSQGDILDVNAITTDALDLVTSLDISFTPADADSAAQFLFRDATTGLLEKLTIGTNLTINAGALDAGGGDAYFVSNSSGTLPSATGADALAVGVGAVAANTNTIAIGRTAGSNGAGADGTGSISIGDGTNAASGVSIGQDSICIGRASQSQSDDSITIGRGAGGTSGTPGTFNISLGFGTNQGSEDIGQNSISIGSVATATFADAIAIGQFAHATASGAIMLGHHTTDIVNDIADSFALGWNEAVPSYWLTKGVATTSSASVVTIVTVALPDQSAYWITARIIGGETDGTPTNFGFFHSEVAYQRVDGAGPVIIGAAVTVASEGAGAGITFTVSSNDILIRIGGVASTNMTWRAVVEFSRRDGL